MQAAIETFPVQHGRVEQTSAHVIRIDETDFEVETTLGRWSARLAASCLLRPAVGDRVLVARSVEDAWILAILDRDPALLAEIGTPGDLAIRSRSGSVSLSAESDIDLESKRKISVSTGEFNLTTRIATAITGRLEYLGQSLQARFDEMSVTGRTLKRLVDCFSSSSRVSVRETEQLEQIRTGTFDCRARDNMTLRGRNILGKARGLAKIDGKQIHIG